MMEKGRMAIRRALSLVCGAALVSGLLLGGCGKKEEVEEKDTRIVVETGKPEIGSIELDGEFVGTVEADNQVNVVAKVAGDVTGTYFEVGDHVEAGELMFTVDDRSAQISMEQAQASMESAQAGAASAQAGVATAQAGADAAQYNMDSTQRQIEETLGTLDTNQMQLENAIKSATYALKAAEENEAYAAEAFGIARDAYEDLEDSIDNLKDSIEKSKKYADRAQENVDYYKGLLSDVNSTETKNVLAGVGINTSDSDYESKAATYLAGKISEASVQAAQYESAISSLRSARDSARDNKNSVKLNQFGAAIQKETSKNNVLSAQDAKAYAEKLLADYEAYTKAKIIAATYAQLAGANSTLVQAQSGIVQARSGVEQANAGIKQAQAAIDGAALQLEYTKVTAPVSGTVTQKNVTVNNMATQTAPAYVITADDAVSITFYVAETVMHELSIGQEIKVERNGEYYTAVISENTGVAEASNGLFKVKAQLKTGADKLITGTTVKLTLATRSAQNVMMIPIDAVYYESQKAYVYCMADGKAVKTPVETGIANDAQIEVKSGLTQDSRIITSWASQLKDGAGVKERDSEGVSENLTKVSEKRADEEETMTVGKTDEDSLIEKAKKEIIVPEAEARR